MSSINMKYLITRKKLILGMLLIFCLTFGIFISQKFYHGDAIALACLESTSEVSTIETSDYYAFIPTPTHKTDAFILYPGALVDAAAYAPLMTQLAENGYISFIAKMPFKMAILKQNAANQIITDYPAITDWYIGGHSLGGVMAASYADKNPELIKGIAFLASYPNKDLTDQSLQVVSIYGSNDTVLNMTAYEEAQALLPTNSSSYTEISINGGNHAGFGNYGMQSGDGNLTISAAAQQEITLHALIDLMDPTH